MRINIKNFKHPLLFSVIMLLLATVIGTPIKASALESFSFTITPMKEKLILNPGDSYSSSVNIYIPPTYNTDVKYTVEASDYFVDENYNNIFDGCGEFCNLRNWITIDSATEGRISPGETKTIFYTINVPNDAAGGGQYASILITGDVWNDDIYDESGSKDNESAAAVKEIKKIAHTIYAEVAGDVIRNGEISNANVPGFLLSGNIAGTSSIKNTGNVHGTATYKLQVFPLFSNEEIYTNEEEPETKTILPDRTLVNTTSWDKTPGIGIFNVVYTAEFEGVITKVEKMVIICPIWLLFVIIFAIIIIIFYFVAKSKSRKKK